MVKAKTIMGRQILEQCPAQPQTLRRRAGLQKSQGLLHPMDLPTPAIGVKKKMQQPFWDKPLSQGL
jgi:hypothetical protein